MNLYEYAVIKDEKTDKDGDPFDPAAVVVPVRTVLAKDPEQASLLAARAIPETEMGDLDRLQVVVRPF